MYRLFIAIDPPKKIRSQLNSLCYGLDGVKWEKEEQIHLTMRFIGNADSIVFEDICLALSTISEKSFTIKIKGVGHFPPGGKAKVLWAGLESSKKLLAVCRTLPLSKKKNFQNSISRIKFLHECKFYKY